MLTTPRMLAAFAVATVAATAASAQSARPTTSHHGAASQSAATHAMSPRVVHVVAVDYAFKAPDTLPAGVTTFHLMNQGKEMHHVTILRLAPGHTVADIGPAMAASHSEMPPAWAQPIGGPNGVAPTGTANATLDLEPGNYVLVCVIPSPTDGKPHMMKGMVHPLTVVPATAKVASAEMPAADDQLTLHDYSFDFSTPLTAGHHVIAVSNTAQQPHEIEIVKLAPGKTPMDVVNWVMKPNGPPPGLPLGGVSALAPGQTNTFSIDLQPGEYGLICFLPDAKDGKPHFAHGMMQTIKVK